MNPSVRDLASILIILVSGLTVSAQADDFWRGFGLRPTSDEPGARIAYVYGRVAVRGYNQTTPFPKISVIFLDAQQSQGRLTIDKAGSYCFRRSNSGGGTLIVEVDGVETARKTLSTLGQAQTREDFEIYLAQKPAMSPPGIISARFARPHNEKTAVLYQKTGEAEARKDLDGAIRFANEIVTIDPEDFVAWAKLGSLYAANGGVGEAETALKRSLFIRKDYTPAMLNLGLLKALQDQIPAAIQLFERAVASDPTSARAYRLLGEAYLQAKRGTDGLAALDEALAIDPQGMAECHLLKARLYDLAGAKTLASAEYKAFLAKVSDHPDKKNFQKYIKDNPVK